MRATGPQDGSSEQGAQIPAGEVAWNPNFAGKIHNICSGPPTLLKHHGSQIKSTCEAPIQTPDLRLLKPPKTWGLRQACILQVANSRNFCCSIFALHPKGSIAAPDPGPPNSWKYCSFSEMAKSGCASARAHVFLNCGCSVYVDRVGSACSSLLLSLRPGSMGLACRCRNIRKVLKPPIGEVCDNFKSCGDPGRSAIPLCPLGCVLSEWEGIPLVRGGSWSVTNF